MSHKSSLDNHNPANYSTNAAFVYSKAYSSPVLDLLSAREGERIIDLGCGTGELTRTIKESVGENGSVVGIDSSQSMLDKAATQSSSESIQYLQADIQDLSTFSAKYPEYQSTFDAVFTSATLHWCKSSPGGVVDLIKWLLKPGGRVAFEFGGFGNTVGVRQALHQVVKSKGKDPVALDPWYFPTVKQYETLLQSKSLQPENVHLVPRPTPLPTDIYGWLTTFARNTWFSEFDEYEADALMREVQELCRADNYWSDDHPGVGVGVGAGPGSNRSGAEKKDGWEIMYVRLRGVAIKP